MEKTDNFLDINIEKHTGRTFFRKGTACVLSSFDNSVFIRKDNGKVYSLMFDKGEANPFTVKLKGKNISFFKKNKNFSINDNIFTSDNQKIHFHPIYFNNKRIKNIHIKEINPENMCILKDFILNQKKEGMSELLHSKKSQFSEYCKTFINDLKFYSSANDIKNFFRTLKNFSGIGPGLTPASDDFICGVLQIILLLTNSSLLNEKWNNLPRLWFLRNIKKKTGTVSFNYIKLSMTGFISNWQYKLLCSLDSSVIIDTKKMSEYGHTSFTDTLTGYYYGLNLFLKKEK